MHKKESTKVEFLPNPLNDKEFENVQVETQTGEVRSVLTLVKRKPRNLPPAEAFDLKAILATGNTALLSCKFTLRKDINSIDAALRAGSELEPQLEKFLAETSLDTPSESSLESPLVTPPE